MTQLPAIDTGDEVRRTGRWARVLRLVEIAELTLGAALLLAILVLVMMQVLSRVTALPSQVWTGEIARFSLVWLAFSLAGYLMGREEHITLDVIDHILPRPGRTAVRIFSLLVIAVTCLTFAYEGYDLLTSGSPIKSPAAGIPIGWIYILPSIGMVLTAIRAILLILVPGTRPRALSDELPAPTASVDADVWPTATEGPRT